MNEFSSAHVQLLAHESIDDSDAFAPPDERYDEALHTTKNNPNAAVRSCRHLFVGMSVRSRRMFMS